MDDHVDDEPTDRALEVQKRYYDVRAPDYLTGAPSDRRPGDFDFGMSQGWRRALVDELQPTGEVLELACGPGGFTRELARHADLVTAVDASRAMLARARNEVARSNVRYVEADVFEWDPDRAYDLVFFGFFLSHVPPGAFAAFWRLVRRCLRVHGRVGFVDEGDRARANDDLREVDGVPVARRTLTDGRSFDVIKVFWSAEHLSARLQALGWDVTVRQVGAGVLYGFGVDARTRAV